MSLRRETDDQIRARFKTYSDQAYGSQTGTVATEKVVGSFEELRRDEGASFFELGRRFGVTRETGYNCRQSMVRPAIHLADLVEFLVLATQVSEPDESIDRIA